MSRRAPRRLDEAMAALAESVQPASGLGRIQRAWEEAVGAGIAAQATPTAEREGVLTVSCRSSAWAADLDLMAPEILERLNGALGAPLVQRLRCIATVPRAWARADEDRR